MGAVVVPGGIACEEEATPECGSHGSGFTWFGITVDVEVRCDDYCIRGTGGSVSIVLAVVAPLAWVLRRAALGDWREVDRYWAC